MNQRRKAGEPAPYTSTRQRQSGQAIAEGGAMLVLFTAVAVGLLLLYLNTAVLGDYQYKMRIAATEAARSYEKQRYWLGIARPDFQPEGAEKSARKVADAVLASLNLPPTTSFTLTEGTTKLEGVADSVTVTNCSIEIDNLRTVGGIFTPFVKLSASGAAAEASVPAYGALQFGFASTSSNDFRAAAVPCYWVGKTQEASNKILPYLSNFNRLGFVQFPVGDDTVIKSFTVKDYAADKVEPW